MGYEAASPTAADGNGQGHREGGRLGNKIMPMSFHGRRPNSPLS